MTDLIKKLRKLESSREINWRACSQAADLIEQQQQRIAELEAKTSCCMGVGNGNGRLFVYGDHESIKTAQRYVLERDELAATVGRLRENLEIAIEAIESLPEDALGDVPDNHEHQGWFVRDELIYNLEQAVKAAPQQNLNAVKREAFISGFMADYAMSYRNATFARREAERKANTKYPSVKE